MSLETERKDSRAGQQEAMHPGAPGKGDRSTGVAEWSGTRLEDTKPEGPESSDPVGRFPTAGQDDKMESFKEAAAGGKLPSGSLFEQFRMQ